MKNHIKIARDFSRTPGARYREDGPCSGEEFREEFLEPLFLDPNNNSPVEIDLDGAAGYATSFLEEAFGGLVRKIGYERCMRKLHFRSTEDELLVKEIQDYMANAQQA